MNDDDEKTVARGQTTGDPESSRTASQDAGVQHTPGPWRVNGGRGGIFQRFQWDIVGPNGEDIAYANPSDGADEPEVYPVDANARLIAAAPDLLDALRTMVCPVCDCSLGHPMRVTDRCSFCAKARAAIAKAEGRS